MSNPHGHSEDLEDFLYDMAELIGCERAPSNQHDHRDCLRDWILERQEEMGKDSP